MQASASEAAAALPPRPPPPCSSLPPTLLQLRTSHKPSPIRRPTSKLTKSWNAFSFTDCFSWARKYCLDSTPQLKDFGSCQIMSDPRLQYVGNKLSCFLFSLRGPHVIFPSLDTFHFFLLHSSFPPVTKYFSKYFFLFFHPCKLHIFVL